MSGGPCVSVWSRNGSCVASGMGKTHEEAIENARNSLRKRYAKPLAEGMSEERVATVFPCGARDEVLRSAWDRVQRDGKVRLAVWDTRPGVQMYPPTMPDGSPLRCTSGCTAPERRGSAAWDKNGDVVDDVWGECVCTLAPKENGV